MENNYSSEELLTKPFVFQRQTSIICTSSVFQVSHVNLFLCAALCKHDFLHV